MSVLLCSFPCKSQQAPTIDTKKSELRDSQSPEGFTLTRQTDQQRSSLMWKVSEIPLSWAISTSCLMSSMLVRQRLVLKKTV